jgi:hypothetical protein
MCRRAAELPSAKKLIQQPFQGDHVCLAPLLKIIVSFFQKLWFACRHPASLEGRIAIVTDVERGMRWAYRVAA